MKKNESMVLTVEEMRQLLRIGRNAAYEGVRTGAIPSIRVGARILVPRRALEQMLEQASNKVVATVEQTGKRR
jgi:excisionase family DNA binding protein